jgi:hypothetical protein
MFCSMAGRAFIRARDVADPIEQVRRHLQRQGPFQKIFETICFRAGVAKLRRRSAGLQEGRILVAGICTQQASEFRKVHVYFR